MAGFRLGLVAASIVAIPLVIAAQQQSSAQQQSAQSRSGWPCGGRLDPSYFQVAEGTGGQLLLLAPEEVGDSARLLLAFGSHPQTIFRLAGTVPPGIHEFKVPIDPSVESVLFSISVQCLQAADVLGPAGAFPTGDGVTDLSSFRAQRMVIVSPPEAGIWTIRVAGSGVAGLVVQAKSALALAHVGFAPAGSEVFTGIPSAAAENAVRVRMTGHPTDVHASIVSGVFQHVAKLPLTSDEEEGSYTARFIPPADGFRLLVTGKDANGFAFQRMNAPLLTPAR
jgi:hypothetical protein